RLRSALFVPVGLLSIVLSAFGAPVAVTNASFELPSPGGFSTNIVGWNITPYGGAYFDWSEVQPAPGTGPAGMGGQEYFSLNIAWSWASAGINAAPSNSITTIRPHTRYSLTMGQSMKGGAGAGDMNMRADNSIVAFAVIPVRSMLLTNLPLTDISCSFITGDA